MTIARGRFQPQQADKGKRLRFNEQIRVTPLRLIDENNEQIGVVELEDARRRALDAGLDLVEVSPGSKPPVCRIMDYGKWKYQQKKKEQKTRRHSKQSELKEVRLRPKIDDHDLKIKTDKAQEFLTEGNKVQFTMQFRGREMAHKNLGLRTLQDICTTLEAVSKVEIPPRMAAGRRMTMVLVPDYQRNKKPKPATDKPPKTDSTKTPTTSTPAPQPPAPADVSSASPAESPASSTPA